MNLLFDSEISIREFESSLATRNIGKRVRYLERTVSTNDLAMRAAAENAPHGTVFIAEVQDGGRGRRGRSWKSPAGLGLLFSVLVRTSANAIAPVDLGWISLLAGLAVNDGIDVAYGMKLKTKWPNDIVIPSRTTPGWKKLGGILCESVLGGANGSTDAAVVIGIGINVNHTRADLPNIAKAPPSSLFLETGETCDRLRVLAGVLEKMEHRLLQLSNKAESAGLKSEISAQLASWWSGRVLKIQPRPGADTSENWVHGKFSGLDEFGRLKISDEISGREIALADAEILAVNNREQ